MKEGEGVVVVMMLVVKGGAGYCRFVEGGVSRLKRLW